MGGRISVDESIFRDLLQTNLFSRLAEAICLHDVLMSYYCVYVLVWNFRMKCLLILSVHLLNRVV